jgi:hypothetical protein
VLFVLGQRRIINSQNIFRFPGTQRFLVNHPDTFPNDLRKLFFIGNRDDSLNRSVAQRFFRFRIRLSMEHRRLFNFQMFNFILQSATALLGKLSEGWPSRIEQ